MTERLYIGIDLGTFQSTIASSKGDIHTIETVVGTPKDPVARNMLGRDTLFALPWVFYLKHFNVYSIKNPHRFFQLGELL